MFKKSTPFVFLISAGLLIGSATPALAWRDPVVVNPYIMESLGPAPNVASQFYNENEARKPFSVTGAKQARIDSYYAAKSSGAQPPSLKKPKSNLNEALYGSTARKTGKFKAAPKSTFRAAGGGFFPAAGTFITNIMGNMYSGYRWNDIDPRTRGVAANVTVTRPNSVVGTVIGSVGFDKGDTDLDSRGMAQVKQAGSQLKSSKNSADITGYASAPKNNPAEARRTALTRILQVRDALIGMGVPGSQLGVKPVGTPETGAKDRVDIVIKR